MSTAFFLFGLMTAALAQASSPCTVDFSFRYYDDQLRVIQYERAGEEWKELRSLPSLTTGDVKSFYDRWCELAVDTCPQGLRDLIEQETEQLGRYQSRLDNAPNERAKERERREVERTQKKIDLLKERLRTVEDLVDQRLKNSDPYVYESGVDDVEIAFINIWKQVFEAQAKSEQEAKQKQIQALKKEAEKQAAEERERQRRREEALREREAERERERQRAIENQVWTCRTDCYYSYYWYSQEFGKRQVTDHWSETSTSVYCIAKGPNGQSDARLECVNRCNQSCARSNYGHQNRGCRLGNLICSKS